MASEDLTVQLRAFEKFLETTLLRDRRRCGMLSASLRKQITHYELVISELDKVSDIRENQNDSRSSDASLLLEVVPGVKRRATISNKDKFIINVGAELFVEFSLLEALRFCYQKIYYLQQSLDSTSAKAVEIEALIAKVTTTLEELREMTVQ